MTSYNVEVGGLYKFFDKGTIWKLVRIDEDSDLVFFVPVGDPKGYLTEDDGTYPFGLGFTEEAGVEVLKIGETYRSTGGNIWIVKDVIGEDVFTLPADVADLGWFKEPDGTVVFGIDHVLSHWTKI